MLNFQKKLIDRVIIAANFSICIYFFKNYDKYILSFDKQRTAIEMQLQYYIYYKSFDLSLYDNTDNISYEINAYLLLLLTVINMDKI